MIVDVYRPDELTTADRTAWTTLQSQVRRREWPHMANPFLSPEFTLAVGNCRRGVRVAVVREPDGEPVAFFPYQRFPAGVGRAIGIGLSDCQGLVHRPGFQWYADELLSACGLALWEFDHLATGQYPFEQSATGSFPSPVIDVAEGWDAYLAQLRTKSPNLIRTTLAKERKLERQHSDVRYVHDERDPAALRTLMEWKSAQYRRTGLHDRFARPWITQLVQQLFHTRSEPFAGILSVLYADGRPVSAHFGLRTERVLAWWFPAYDPAFSKYSPGLILLMHLAEASARDGIAYLDLGRGESRYKDSFKTGELSVSEGLVSRRHPVALALGMSHAPVRALADAVFSHPQLFGRADRLLKSARRPREWRNPT
ncbi:GNAT family N-acetyltransferase [Streptomyces griseorubiginosus]|uniref:GNAT family N-acetyltransferase n=1 Tax=Streptomyces griseorubiginosus TaxID=67304 RepID=UPI0033B0A89B